MKPISYPYWAQQQSALEHLQQVVWPRKLTPEEIKQRLILERIETRKRYLNRVIRPKKLKKQTCPFCGDKESLTVERRRRNTMYHNDELNYEVSCIHCFEDGWAQMQELWDDYNSSRL